MATPDDEDREPDPGTTAVLIERVRDGDEAALGELMTRFLPRVRRWASGRVPAALRTMADTSDIVQDVLLRTFRRVERLDVEREGGLQAYLRRAVLNRIRDEFRQAHVRRPGAELDSGHPDEAPSPLESAIGREVLERYEAALAGLRPIDREAIIARIEMGFSYAEVAQLIGKPSPNAARMAVERAMQRVLDAMSKR
jgi:RNA polymerase sigma-70 factor (ECF subfamily)